MPLCQRVWVDISETSQRRHGAEDLGVSQAPSDHAHIGINPTVPLFGMVLNTENLVKGLVGPE